ncbi:dTDP-4-dehydrorhamnose 3,5-epimerase [Halobacteriovorax sp. JY17]|uniref:dTDP-4-dehydrorhamnose 3,5-epimerase n=1 Tax=Halobacteriovorax sp. JY17 TaxID=2014617 RepID=UPI000C390209|nr:dTDP-4-dehydrorhamnose 3,5-epimerase [Halobacteriovorax sp. JY17]PIK14714.1 MAG: dTDP-4-dehydrorhamnose 3,5-epimerase [Halobacteriovorax sp. JY17]
MIETTFIKDLVIFTPRVFEDERGHFFESYNEKSFLENGITTKFVQDNQSFSTYGTLRGMHLQRGDHAQAKLVRVTKGEVLDVAVDLRPDSATFGKYLSVKLSEENHKQIFIPRGFAHGFVVLSKEAIFQYKVDNYYNKESEAGFIFNDPSIAIDWLIPESDISLSEKDQILPSFNGLKERL